MTTKSTALLEKTSLFRNKINPLQAENQNLWWWQRSYIRSSDLGVRDLSNGGIFCQRHLEADWSLSHNHITEKAIFYVLKVIVNLLHPSVRYASPQPATTSSYSGSCCHCPAAAPGVSWQLPACSHHGCCRHHHIQADALVTVILLLMEVIGTSSCHIKGQKLFPNRRHRAIWHPLLPLLVTTLPATMPAATITSLAQGVWQSPSNLWKQPLREASHGHSKYLCVLKSAHRSPASLFLICFWRCKQLEN